MQEAVSRKVTVKLKCGYTASILYDIRDPNKSMIQWASVSFNDELILS